MAQCVAVGCFNKKTNKKPGLTFHRFPVEKESRKAWEIALKRDFKASDHSLICSVHFREEDFDKSSPFVTKIKKGVIPTIFSEISDKHKMPGSVCSVATCKSNAIISRKLGDNVRFFTFPRDPKLQREWVRRCYRPEKFIPTNKRICSKHFKPDDFEDAIEAKIRNRLPKILKRDCIPSLNLKPENNLNVIPSDTKKTRLERAAKRKQRDFIKRILQEEKDQDFDSEMNDKSENKGNDMDESGVTDMVQNDKTDLTSEDLITAKAEAREKELERRISQFFSSKVQILFAELI